MVIPKEYLKCVVITDYFKFFNDHPNNLFVQAQTYSFYKDSHTANCLIGNTPQCTVSFISDGCEGRNDTEQSTLFK